MILRVFPCKRTLFMATLPQQNVKYTLSNAQDLYFVFEERVQAKGGGSQAQCDAWVVRGAADGAVKVRVSLIFNTYVDNQPKVRTMVYSGGFAEKHDLVKFLRFQGWYDLSSAWEEPTTAEKHRETVNWNGSGGKFYK